MLYGLEQHVCAQLPMKNLDQITSTMFMFKWMMNWNCPCAEVRTAICYHFSGMLIQSCVTVSVVKRYKYPSLIKPPPKIILWIIREKGKYILSHLTVTAWSAWFILKGNSKKKVWSLSVFLANPLLGYVHLFFSEADEKSINTVTLSASRACIDRQLNASLQTVLLLK